MFSTHGDDFQFMDNVQKQYGATSEEAAWLLACEPDRYQQEMHELQLWAGLITDETTEVVQ